MQTALAQLDEVWTAAKAAVAERRCGVDPDVPGDEARYGTGITVTVPLDDAARAALVGVAEELSRFDASQYWYPAEALHVTLHSVRWLEPGPLPSETEFRKIENTLRHAVTGALAPGLEIRGVTLFPGDGAHVGAVVAQCFPNADLLLVRDRVRQASMDIGYPDRRNYAFGRGQYLTCALARLRKQPAGKLVDAIGEMRGRPLATLRPTRLDLVTNGYFFLPGTVRERASFLVPT